MIPTIPTLRLSTPLFCPSEASRLPAETVKALEFEINLMLQLATVAKGVEAEVSKRLKGDISDANAPSVPRLSSILRFIGTSNRSGDDGRNFPHLTGELQKDLSNTSLQVTLYHSAFEPVPPCNKFS